MRPESQPILAGDGLRTARARMRTTLIAFHHSAWFSRFGSKSAGAGRRHHGRSIRPFRSGIHFIGTSALPRDRSSSVSSLSHAFVVCTAFSIGRIEVRLIATTPFLMCAAWIVGTATISVNRRTLRVGRRDRYWHGSAYFHGHYRAREDADGPSAQFSRPAGSLMLGISNGRSRIRRRHSRTAGSQFPGNPMRSRRD
jgi:hypothetical protein